MSSLSFGLYEKLMANAKLLILALLFLGMLGITGCPATLPPLGSPATIDRIHADHQGQSVRLVGTVTQRAMFLQGGAYQLQDESGSIWVLTQQPVPEVGDRLSIQGEITYDAIAVQGQELGEVYIDERDRQLPSLVD